MHVSILHVPIIYLLYVYKLGHMPISIFFSIIIDYNNEKNYNNKSVIKTIRSVSRRAWEV